MKHVPIMILFLILAGCALGKTDEKAKSVYITGGGKVQTTYTLDAEGRVARSAVTDDDGNVTTRLYSYNAQRELKAIAKTSPSGETATIYVATEMSGDEARRTAATRRTISGSKGGSEQVDVQYIYDEEGKLIGMVQRDASGNVKMKTLNDRGVQP